jgi:hypothetical protein
MPVLAKGLSLLVLLDGVTTTILGKRFLRALRTRLPFPAALVARFFLLWPEALLRRGAAMQALTGLVLLRAAREG